MDGKVFEVRGGDWKQRKYMWGEGLRGVDVG